MSNTSEPTSQFWSDFWATIYHFTHPFSSTFFDQLFETQHTSNEGGGGNPDPSVVATSNLPPHTATTATLSEPTPLPPHARHFTSPEAFQKYWKSLQTGQDLDQQQPQPIMEQLRASWVDFRAMALSFINAVNWQQWWIQAILTMHVVLFVTIIMLRNRPNALTGVLLVTIVLAASSEPLNRLGHARWQKFADSDYFDDHGVFATVIWAMPLLLNGLFAVVLLVRKTIQLLVKVKRVQVAADAAKKRKKNK